MERLLQVTLAAAAAAGVGGCAAADRITAGYLDAKAAVVGAAPAPPRPATQVQLVLHRQLARLPDPTRADAQQAGLPGQVFLLGADNRPVAAAGDLTVTVVDATERPPGQPPRDTEKWQFTADVLPRLAVKDQRFGDCYALFLPWPPDWADVRRVTVKAVYQPAGGVELHTPETQIVLDTGGPPEVSLRRDLPAFQVPKVTNPNASPAPPPAAGQPIPLPPPTANSPPSAATPAAAGPVTTVVLPRGG